MAIDEARLRGLLVRIVEATMPHDSKCNLKTEHGRYGHGCTCNSGKQQETFIKQIHEIIPMPDCPTCGHGLFEKYDGEIVCNNCEEE
jgi:hypothetical protein